MWVLFADCLRAGRCLAVEHHSPRGPGVDVFDDLPDAPAHLLFEQMSPDDVADPVDESGLFLADLDSLVSTPPEFLLPSDDSIGLASEIAVDEAHEARELVDIVGAEQHMGLIGQAAEGIEVYGEAFLGSVHDADGDAAKALAGEYEIAALQARGVTSNLDPPG